MLWRNLFTTVALLALLVDLADTCQGQVKCQLVVDTLKGMVFLALPLLSTCPQHNLVVPGVSCPLLVDPDGQVSLEILLVPPTGECSQHGSNAGMRCMLEGFGLLAGRPKCHCLTLSFFSLCCTLSLDL